MKNLIQNSVDWFSIKLNAICFIGLISTSKILTLFTFIATLTTITYNGIKIYNELKYKKKNKK